MKTERGVTLLEAILALAIAGSLITMGIAWYGSFKRDNDIRQIGVNVDTLALSAAKYYYANCYGTTNADGSLNPGTLNPESTAPEPLPDFYPLDITADLIDTGYLTQTIPVNPMVDGVPAINGYAVQFAKRESIRKICTESASCTDEEAKQIGTIVNWGIQVGVKIKDIDNIDVYSQITNASCVSSKTKKENIVGCESAATYQQDCQALETVLSEATTPEEKAAAEEDLEASGCPDASDTSAFNNYLVFERQPRASQNALLPAMWPTMPVVRQFTNMYRTYSTVHLLNSSHDPEYQYFLCGS